MCFGGGGSPDMPPPPFIPMPPPSRPIERPQSVSEDEIKERTGGMSDEERRRRAALRRHTRDRGPLEITDERLTEV